MEVIFVSRKSEHHFFFFLSKKCLFNNKFTHDSACSHNLQIRTWIHLTSLWKWACRSNHRRKLHLKFTVITGCQKTGLRHVRTMTPLFQLCWELGINWPLWKSLLHPDNKGYLLDGESQRFRRQEDDLTRVKEKSPVMHTYCSWSSSVGAGVQKWDLGHCWCNTCRL